MKHYRALQEQASTYLDLVCSVCDLSDDAVRVTAAEVQQVKLTVSDYYFTVTLILKPTTQNRNRKFI